MDWNGEEMYLYSETGFNLTIRSNGIILGSENDDLESRLRVISAGEVSNVRIQSIANKRFLCFDETGNLYGEVDPNIEATVFIEEFQGSYTAYKSKVFPDWYVGIKKNGTAKMGPKTKWGQKAVKFLPRRQKFSS